MKNNNYCKSLADVAVALSEDYHRIYRYRHLPEFKKTDKGYSLTKIKKCLAEKAIEEEREREAKEAELAECTEDLIQKQIKLETSRHKCRLLELQILQKEGNLVDVNQVIETRAKEISRLRKGLTELVRKVPVELANQSESFIRERLSDLVNAILSDLSEFIADDWNDSAEESDNVNITDDEE